MDNTLKDIYGSSNNKDKIEIDYEENYQNFLVKLDEVAGFEPKRKYLYAVMDSVAYKDTDNALDIAIENKQDNG